MTNNIRSKIWNLIRGGSFRGYLRTASGYPLTLQGCTGEIIEIAAPITTDISDKIDWNSIPRLWRGTAVLTSDTTVQPSEITAQYYADKPDEEVN